MGVGYKHTPETIQKIKQAVIGKSAKYWLNKKRSIETKNKISTSLKGKPSWNKGKPAPWAKGVKIGTPAWNKGRKWDEETKKKMRGKRPNNSGKKSFHWKGGINPINNTIRKSLDYKAWHRACLDRDNFTCQKTGQHGGDLVVHHINNFSEFPELRTSIENGVTLSKKSHEEFHKKYGFRNNTKEQLIEFLDIESQKADNDFKRIYKQVNKLRSK